MKPSAEEVVARPAPAGPLSERVYEALKERIGTGVYGADERLPGEYDLAAQFDVSRPIVREALEQLGFAPVETIADIQRCYEFRLTIEPEAAAYAARRRNDEALARIEAALAMMDDATRQHRHREDADFAFHISVAKAANNHYHLSALQALREHIAVGMKLHGLTLMGPTPGLQRVFAEHTGIFEAIRTGDEAAASTRMHAHLKGSLERLFEGRLLDLSL